MFCVEGASDRDTESWIKVWSLNEKEFLKFDREGSLYYLTASPRKKGRMEKVIQKSCKLSRKGVKWKSMMLMYCWDTLEDATRKARKTDRLGINRYSDYV